MAGYDYASEIFGTTKTAVKPPLKDYASEIFGISPKPESEGVQRNADGTYGTPPEGMIYNPDTGQMTSRDLLTEHHRQTGSQGGAALRMAPHGTTLGLSDEAVALGSMVRGKDAANFALENERAKIDANRSEYPVTSIASEVAGGLAVPATILSNSGKATSFGQAVKQGAKAGAGTGAIYGLGEGEGEGRLRSAGFGLIGGAAGGAASVPVAKVAGWAAKKIGAPVARLLRDRRYYTEEGGISPAGRDALKQLGYDADEISDAFAREFSKGIDDGVDPTLAARAAEMEEFGIPAFKHNVTGDVNDFADFERARRGVGPDAVVSKAQRLGDGQELSARRAVDGVAKELSDGIPADQLDAAQAVTSRLQTMSEAEKAAAQAMYKAADDAGVSVPGNVAKGVVQRVQSRVAAEEIDLTSDIYSNARAYMSRLQKRGEGDGGVSLRLIETFRKDLNQSLSRAKPEDKRALSIIKNEYDSWVDDVVTAKLFDGDEAGFGDLKEARRLFAQYSAKYRGKDAGSRFLQDMIDADASPDQVMRWMFGASKLGSGKMNAPLAAKLKHTLGKSSDEWNLVRQAAFRQLTQKSGTETPGATGPIPWGPQKVSENIRAFFNSPQTKPLANVLFTPKERGQMIRLSTALNRMVPPKGAVNHSGTGYENARVAKKMWEGALILIGYKAGGPAGAVAGRAAAKGTEKGAGWLQAGKIGQKVRGQKPIGPVATGAIPGASAGMFVEDITMGLLFPGHQE
ncbi:hypothetical protein I5192_03165 [Ruegeria sp. SCSIO 43209]|uniref:hypothetical protein n=1 Tax=Ruegeria sp. SCSIO 43209 TaxID=2793010 RepID=UPI001CA92570|nr:hypothetical protein [Ruegeria sp. SCSIO 43209]UAB89697.1 hypothetical protein I5192_03165 [Ruegeria sp. SCSIO 43209]